MKIIKLKNLDKREPVEVTPEEAALAYVFPGTDRKYLIPRNRSDIYYFNDGTSKQWFSYLTSMVNKGSPNKNYLRVDRNTEGYRDLIAVHRLVCFSYGDMVGKKLRYEEVKLQPTRPTDLDVHHVSGDYNDNSPENLFILSHAEHQLLERYLETKDEKDLKGVEKITQQFPALLQPTQARAQDRATVKVRTVSKVQDAYEYYLISGLDQGYPIKPYVLKINPYSRADQNKLDSHLAERGDMARYYEKITPEEARRVMRESQQDELK